MIRVRNLSKSFGATPAVNDISFEISAGEIIGFLGPNGAGKSTTMRMLTGFLGPDRGTIEISGRSIRENLEYAKAQIGYLPENNPLYEEMTVLEYLNFIGELRGLDPETRKSRIEENIKLYGLTAVVTKDISELSKGYRQRVGLAQTALTNPPILILDEPTSGLDPNQIIEIRNLIKEMGKTKTVILSTHNLAEVEAVCSRILIINAGRIVADDTPDALEKKSSGGLLNVRVKAAGDISAALSALKGVRGLGKPETDDGWSLIPLTLESASEGVAVGERVFDLAVKNGWKLSELRTETVTLENVFTKLTRG